MRSIKLHCFYFIEVTKTVSDNDSSSTSIEEQLPCQVCTCMSNDLNGMYDVQGTFVGY